MRVYIFSYNRGGFLHNCVTSLFKCIKNVSVTIVDDNSDDIDTLKILEKWSSKCEIATPSSSNIAYKLGGLYKNMNYAMNDACDKKLDNVMFMQDDMQMVRMYTKEDDVIINKFFKENKRSVQYSPCFFKLGFKKPLSNRRLNESKIVYFKNKRSQYSGYSDIGIFHVERFKENFVNFEVGERKMDNLARKKGIRRGEAVYPFMMYLPFPKSYRDKNRSMTLRISEKISGAGYYPINYMDEKELKVFFERDPSFIPYAEEYLTVKGINKKPWSFAGGVTALYEQGGWKRMIGRLIKRF